MSELTCARLKALAQTLANESGGRCSGPACPGCTAGRLFALLDATAAPTEDAAAENRRAFIETAQEIGMMLAPAVSRAADTAAEEPRTEAQCESILPGGSHACGGHRSEAQIKAEALREAADDWCVTEDPHESDLIDNGHIDQWLRDRADRLSRADEGAGS